MKNQVEISNPEINLDGIQGRTLEERAKIILCTLGRNQVEIRRAYRRLAFQYHPDKQDNDGEKFKLDVEAYEILMEGKYPKRLETSLLANDGLVVEFTGRRVEVLDFIQQQKEFEEYMRKHIKQFYEGWLI